MPDAPAPQPAASPAPPAKKMGVLPKILVGCLGLLVLIGILLSVAAWWGARKLQGYADNPAALAARMIVAGNPDLEIASEDSRAKTVTIRNKKTGDVVTMNAADLEKGKIEFQNAKGEKVTFDGGEGKSGVTVESKEGKTTLGSGAAAAPPPSWVPAYPGAKPENLMSAKGPKGVEGMLTFETGDSVAKVLDFYQPKLEGSGFKVERLGSEDTAGTLAAKADGESRQVNVSAAKGDGGKVSVTVQFSGKGE